MATVPMATSASARAARRPITSVSSRVPRHVIAHGLGNASSRRRRLGGITIFGRVFEQGEVVLEGQVRLLVIGFDCALDIFPNGLDLTAGFLGFGLVGAGLG